MRTGDNCSLPQFPRILPILLFVSVLWLQSLLPEPRLHLLFHVRTIENLHPRCF
ncbi:hypothetical protein OROHE_014995 [Orobanche hederae]